MQFVNNEPEQIEIRRSQNTLIVVGSGTVLFSIWTAAKIWSLLFLLRKEIVAALLVKTGPIENISDDTVFWVITVLITILVLIALAVRLYVGLSAIAEGRGKKRSLLYIIIAIVIIAGNILNIFARFFATEAPAAIEALLGSQSTSTFIIDATSIIMLTQMVVSALKIRKYKKTKRKAKD